MDKKWLDRLKRIENRSMTLLVLATPLAQTALDDIRVTFGLALGGCFELLNLYLFRRTLEKILEGVSREKARVIYGAMALKVVVLGLGLYLGARFVPVNSLALLGGAALVIASALVEPLLPDKKQEL